MIKIDKVEDGYPVSVIIPYTPKGERKSFFEKHVLPSIEAMNPNEIIINDNIGTAPKKRNDGFKKSTQPYVLFADDDILFPSDFLNNALKALEKNPKKGYAYSGYKGIVFNSSTHPMKGNFKIPSIQFNGIALKQGNYISTMSVLKREHFPGFDENLKRLQDWSLWLTLLENGVEGICVPEMEFLAFYLDEGITSNSNSEQDAYNAIRLKHKI